MSKVKDINKIIPGFNSKFKKINKQKNIKKSVSNSKASKKKGVKSKSKKGRKKASESKPAIRYAKMGRPGRIAKNNAELWERREKEYILYSQGMSCYKIARIMGVGRGAVEDDLKAMAQIESPIKVKHQIEEIFNQVIQEIMKRLLKATNKELPKLIEQLIEANTRKAKLMGIYSDVTVQNNINNAVGLLKGATERNGYEKLKDDEVIMEFKRRKGRFFE